MVSRHPKIDSQALYSSATLKLTPPPVLHVHLHLSLLWDPQVLWVQSLLVGQACLEVLVELVVLWALGVLVPLVHLWLRALATLHQSSPLSLSASTCKQQRQ